MHHCRRIDELRDPSTEPTARGTESEVGQLRYGMNAYDEKTVPLQSSEQEELRGKKKVQGQ